MLQPLAFVHQQRDNASTRQIIGPHADSRNSNVLSKAQNFTIHQAGTIPKAQRAANMLYELIAIVRPGNLVEVKEIAQTVGSLVLRNGGVVRGLSNWGVFSLPKPISVHQMKHTHGHYFVMRYDSSTKVHQDLRTTLRLEPRMIRSAHVKLGDGKLNTLSRFGPPKWRTQGSEA